MILAICGTQLPFDRLLRAIDAWAAAHTNVPWIVQALPGSYAPTCFEPEPWIEPAQLRRHIAAASVVVGHAGIGTILWTLEAGRPLILMPRRRALGEHRSTHQEGTAAGVEGEPGLYLSHDGPSLWRWLDHRDELVGPTAIGRAAPKSLLESLRRAVDVDAPHRLAARRLLGWAGRRW